MGSNQAPIDPYKAKNKDDDVPMEDKMKDLFNFIDQNQFCMMTTQTKEGLLASRCMALAGKEDNGTTLIFHMNSHSGKHTDISHNPSQINLAFLTSSNGDWASISGTADIKTAEHGTPEDKELIKKHYTASLRAWIGDLGDGVHDGGPDDPRLGIICVKAKTATYALHRTNVVSRAMEVAKGTITGDAASVNLLRSVTETEMREWAEAET